MNDAIKEQFIARLIEKYGTEVRRNQLEETANEPQFIGSGVNWRAIRSACTSKERGLYDLTSVAGAGVAIGVSGDTENSIIAFDQMTDEEIRDEQRKNFATMEMMADRGISRGKVRGMIVSGPAGIGKTYSLEAILNGHADSGHITVKKVSGYMLATGLFKLLYENCGPEQILLIDDCDKIFGDETSLNILKAALDTKRKRWISWRSEKQFTTADGEEIPNEFLYEGCIIFITNLDFRKAGAENKSLAPHLNALISRSFYIDLNMATKREQLIRIEDVVAASDMMYTLGMDEPKTTRIMDYVRENYMRLDELSLRMIVKLAATMDMADGDPDMFRTIADSTCCRKRSGMKLKKASANA